MIKLDIGWWNGLDWIIQNPFIMVLKKSIYLYQNLNSKWDKKIKKLIYGFSLKYKKWILLYKILTL